MQCPRCEGELYLRMGVHSIETYKLVDTDEEGTVIPSQELLSIDSFGLSTDNEELICDYGHEFPAEYDEDLERWVLTP